MRSFAVAAVLWLGWSGAADAGGPADVPVLIERLGSGAFRERTDAFRALDALGEAALVPLRVAAASNDVETRHLATELIQRIEHRLATARILTPTLIELDYKDVLIPNAIASFAGKTGLGVSIVGDTSRLREKRVTYHSGKVPVWEALAGLAAAAHLAEWDGLTPQKGLPAPFVTAQESSNFRTLPGGGRIFFSGSGRAPQQNQPRSLCFYDAAPVAVPTCIAGPVRVRALPVGTPLPTPFSDLDEIVVPLQVSAESKLVWHDGGPSVKIGTAVDDRGQRLSATVIGFANPTVDDEDFIFRQAIIANQLGAYGQASPGQLTHFLPLRFRRGEMPSKSLAAVSGTLTLPIEVTGEIAAIDRHLMPGTTARGDFGSLTLHKVETAADGAIKMEISMDLSPGVQPNYHGQRSVSLKQQFQGNMLVQEMSAYNPRRQVTEILGLSLSNAQGNKFFVTAVGQQTISTGGEGIRVKTVLTFKRPKEGGDAVRLSLCGHHPAVVELPFEFKDIPLP